MLKGKKFTVASLYKLLCETPAGRDASWIFFVFHGGAVAAFTHAWANGAIPLGKVVVPHLPFAVAFLAHALS